MTFSGIVLAGGAARRLSGVDKPLLEVGGISLLDKAIAALAGAEPIVVVGPERPGVTGVRWTREEPAGSGPLAALDAGLGLVDGDEVAVLAADLAAVTATTIARLRAALSTKDGAVLVDADGRRQWLIGVWRAERLVAAMPAQTSGKPLRATLSTLDVIEVRAEPGEAVDIDTPDDLHSVHTEGKAR